MTNQNCESNSRRCGDCVKFGANSRRQDSLWCGRKERNPETRGRGCFIGHGLFLASCQEREKLHGCYQETGGRNA